MIEIRSLKKWINDYELIKSNIDDLEVLFEYYKSDEISEEELTEHWRKTVRSLEELEFKNMLSEEGDSLNAVIQITAGAGGTES